MSKQNSERMNADDPIAWSYVVDPRMGVPDDYVLREAAHRIGPKLFGLLLAGGKTVVEVVHDVRQAFGHPWERSGSEHCFRVYRKAVRQMDLVEYRVPDPDFRSFSLAEPERPRPIRKAVNRVTQWLAREWRRAGTNPGIEYDGPRG